MAEPKIISAYVGLPAVGSIPTNMTLPGIMSTTSSAPECFINQKFSSKLQAYLISYVNSTQSDYAIYSV